MTRRQTYVLGWLLAASFICGAQSSESALSAEEYRGQLDRLSAATEQLDTSGRPVPQALHELPQSWQVRTERGNFEISSEGLQGDLRRYESDKSFANAAAIRARVLSLRRDFDGYESPAPDVNAPRNDLKAILARPEFRDVSGPSLMDRLREKLLSFIRSLLQRVFMSSALPGIGKFFVYGLIALAVLGLAYIAYRNITQRSDFEAVTPKDMPVSAKEWTLWLDEARSAAARHKWRDAVHLAYWAGISFLERGGAWKPDRARTPREYLKLLDSSSKDREALSTLTQIFELVWYAKRNADTGTFSRAMDALERLGCR